MIIGVFVSRQECLSRFGLWLLISSLIFSFGREIDLFSADCGHFCFFDRKSRYQIVFNISTLLMSFLGLSLQISSTFDAGGHSLRKYRESAGHLIIKRLDGFTKIAIKITTDDDMRIRKPLFKFDDDVPEHVELFRIIGFIFLFLPCLVDFGC